MVLLKRDNHTKGYKLIGVSVPLWVHNYISLYCLAKNKTKSEIMKGWVGAWHDQVKSKEPEEKLVQEIIDMSNTEWAGIKKKTPEKTFVEFKEELEKELVCRGVSIYQIRIILKAIKQ
jgi:hypothetical protein